MKIIPPGVVAQEVNAVWILTVIHNTLILCEGLRDELVAIGDAENRFGFFSEKESASLGVIPWAEYCVPLRESPAFQPEPYGLQTQQLNRLMGRLIDFQDAAPRRRAKKTPSALPYWQSPVLLEAVHYFFHALHGCLEVYLETPANYLEPQNQFGAHTLYHNARLIENFARNVLGLRS